MPELPEVETVVRSIRDRLVGNSLSSMHVSWIRTLDNFDEALFNKCIKNKKVLSVDRRAKYILIRFKAAVLAVHLRMTGKLYISNNIKSEGSHVRVYFNVEDRFLVFSDTRKFGRIYLFPDTSHLDSKLGIEPLSSDFTY